jgi:hypothetical protein
MGSGVSFLGLHVLPKLTSLIFICGNAQRKNFVPQKYGIAMMHITALKCLLQSSYPEFKSRALFNTVVKHIFGQMCCD